MRFSLCWLCQVVLASAAGAFVFLVPDTPKVLKVQGNATLELRVASGGTNVPNDTAFWVFECHTQRTPMSLLAPKGVNFTQRQTFPGSHRGIVLAHRSGANVSQSVFLKNQVSSTASAVVIARAYTVDHPLPGACHKLNSTGTNGTKPDINVYYDKSTVHVSVHNAGQLQTPSFSCGDAPQHEFSYTFYLRYLDHRNFDETYFLTELAETMLLAQDIKHYMHPVSPEFLRVPDGEGVRKILTPSYPGNAAMYAVIVTRTGVVGGRSLNNGTGQVWESVYVGTATYACVLQGDKEGRERGEEYGCTDSIPWGIKIICLMSMVFGCFLAFVGHRYFTFHQFTYGFLLGVLISFVVGEGTGDLGYTSQFFFSLGLGSLLGSIWLGIWLIFAKPNISIFIPSSLVGVVIAGGFFQAPFMQTVSVVEGSSFWYLGLGLVLSVPVLFLSIPKQASIFCSVFIGCCLAVLPIDFYLGGFYKYLIINIIRRVATVDFQYAVVYMPLQHSDYMVFGVTVAVALAAFAIQTIREDGRQPFPDKDALPCKRLRQERRRYRNRYDYSEDTDDDDDRGGSNAGESNPLLRGSRLGPRDLERIRAAVVEIIQRHSPPEERPVAVVSGPLHEVVQANAVAPASAPPLLRGSVPPSSVSSVPCWAQTEARRGRVRDIFKPPTPPSGHH